MNVFFSVLVLSVFLLKALKEINSSEIAAFAVLVK